MHQYLNTARKEIEPKQFRQIHSNCEKAVEELKSKEAALIRALQEVDKYKVYRFLGLKSLFQYALALGLSESQACAFIAVARKSTECPALQKALDKNELTVSKAKSVTSVMTERNQNRWIEAAKTMPKKQLEKEVAKIKPRAVNPESVRFLNDHLLQMNVPVEEETYKLIERARDLICQKTKRVVSLEECLEVMIKHYLERHDPVEKAKRAVEKNAKPKIKKHSPGNVNSGQSKTRKKLPAHILHQVHQRDQGRCQFKLTNGSKCNQGRWVELHHKIPRSQGGADSPENLITLCSGHHRILHENPS